MENIKDLTVSAHRIMKDDYIGGVTFFNPMYQTKKSRPASNVMFIYEPRPLSLDDYIISFDDAHFRNYLEENDLMNEFIRLLNEFIDNNSDRIRVVE